MNSPIRHEYVHRLEAPMCERAAASAAQRNLALQKGQGSRRAFGVTFRHTLGQALVGIGRSIQVRPAKALGNRPEGAA